MADNWLSLLFETCELGASSAVAPELLPDRQVAWGMNIDVRGGKAATRPGLRYRLTLPPGLVQGAEYFGVQNGMLVASVAGRIYKVRVNGSLFSYEEVPLDFVNSPVIKQVWMTQTVETLVIQDGQSNAILYNGSSASRSTGFQVPRGRQMAYGNGRLWVAVNANNILAGDIRTGTAGSELLFTEATYLQGGGKLFFTSDTTAMAFIPVTGQSDYGVLVIFGADESNAIRADITSRDDWGKVPGFVSTLLRSTGAAGQWNVTSINQDLYWRDSNGGIRSIRNALADEAGPGSAPVSREVSRLTDYDSQQLLPFCSGVYFDNRVLVTSSPFLLPNGGIGWRDIIPLDFAPLSTMGGKSQPAYNGKWNGLRFVKLVGGKFGGKNRAFAICTDEDGSNQLWEFESSVAGQREDTQVACTDGTATVDPYPVQSLIEYPRRNFGNPKQRKLLSRCDVWLSDVSGEVELEVYWRADNWQKWLLWDEAATCAKVTDPSTDTPHVWKNLRNQERPQFKTFTIPDTINELVGYAAAVGFEFQVRLVWRGQCRIHRVMLHAQLQDDPDHADRTGFSETCVENDITGNQIQYAIPSTGCALCPAITLQPVETTVEAPDEATFEVEYDGEPVTFQWQLSTDAGETWENVPATAPYSGTTTSQLTVNPTNSDLNGNQYRCVLTRDGCAVATSEGGGLNVDCPTITDQPDPQTIDEGADTTFTVATSFGGNTYQWQVSTNGGGVWANVTNGTNYSGATTDTLSVLDAPLSFDGNLYRCIVSHDGCSPLTSSTALLTVEELAVEATWLVVGGGAGGGYSYGGGGGAGAVEEDSGELDLSTSYPVVVGAKGLGGVLAEQPGGDGTASSFNGTTALGGGGGGALGAAKNGRSGACGGGGAAIGAGGGAGGVGGTGSTGFDGGDGNWDGGDNAAAGGGAGASEDGGTDTSHPLTKGGDGGDGIQSSITGTPTYYGGGGGGGVSFSGGSGDTGKGGLGGGGDGGRNGSGGGAITPNSGGGGGGAGVNAAGGDGADGLVIVRYAGAPLFSGGSVSTSGGFTRHTFTTSGTLAPL